ncbi:hypothetical protein GCM10020216_084650 [Nonomuraea helvata]
MRKQGETELAQQFLAVEHPSLLGSAEGEPPLPLIADQMRNYIEVLLPQGGIERVGRDADGGCGTAVCIAQRLAGGWGHQYGASSGS